MNDKPIKKSHRDVIAERVASLTSTADKILPRGVSIDTFREALSLAYIRSPDLIDATTQSVYMAIMTCARDGLMPDGEDAVILPRKSKKTGVTTATYQRMYKGLLKLARNSGSLTHVTAHVIYDTDHFEEVYGTEDTLIHRPTPIAEKIGEPVGVYCKGMVNGRLEWMTLRADRVRQLAAQGYNQAQYDHKSGVNWSSWWRKAAISAFLRQFATTPDIVRAASDDTADPVLSLNDESVPDFSEPDEEEVTEEKGDLPDF